MLFTKGAVVYATNMSGSAPPMTTKVGQYNVYRFKIKGRHTQRCKIGRKFISKKGRCNDHGRHARDEYSCRTQHTEEDYPACSSMIYKDIFRRSYH